MNSLRCLIECVVNFFLKKRAKVIDGEIPTILKDVITLRFIAKQTPMAPRHHRLKNYCFGFKDILLKFVHIKNF